MKKKSPIREYQIVVDFPHRIKDGFDEHDLFEVEKYHMALPYEITSDRRKFAKTLEELMYYYREIAIVEKDTYVASIELSYNSTLRMKMIKFLSASAIDSILQYEKFTGDIWICHGIGNWDTIEEMKKWIRM